MRSTKAQLSSGTLGKVMPKVETPINIRLGDLDDHKKICAVAKQSPYTRDFSNIIFSGPDCYEAGRVIVMTRGENVLGFVSFRPRKRDEVTVLYFVGVTKEERGKGLGQRLLDDLWQRTSQDWIELKVMKDNPAGDFYLHRGFKTIGEAYEGKAHVMKCARTDYRFNLRAK